MGETAMPVPVSAHAPAIWNADNERRVRVGLAWNALAEETRRAYMKAFTRIRSFIAEIPGYDDIDNVTDELLSVYLQGRAKDGITPSGLSIDCAAVGWYFKNVLDIKHSWISSKRVIWICKREGGHIQRSVDGITWQETETVCALAYASGTLRGVRDASLIRLMSDCLLRISEAVAVNCGDLRKNALTVRGSKTDQVRKGATLYVGDYTIKTIEEYKARAGIEKGALFRRVVKGDNIHSARLSTCAARTAIKRWAKEAGVTGIISGHSLRVGSAVSLADAGASVVDMQLVGRWKSSEMPVHYARSEMAERGAIAEYKYGKRR